MAKRGSSAWKQNISKGNQGKNARNKGLKGLQPWMKIIGLNKGEPWNKGKVIRVKEPIIHSLNKVEIAVKNYPVYKSIKNRRKREKIEARA